MVKVSQLEDSTTESGSANAASLSLGTYREDVDILVNGSGTGWTVTVEVQDANGDWIQYAAFSRDDNDDDVLQVSTVANDIRAYFDTDVARLTMYAKGDD